jgi:hypothetical protein
LLSELCQLKSLKMIVFSGVGSTWLKGDFEGP